MFASEVELQYWLADRLRAAGYSPEVEIVTDARHKTRADIVCGDTVIECKKTLDRDAMHQAASQASVYAVHLGLSGKVIVGMPPSSAAAQRSARSASVAIMSADPNISMYWINQSGVFPVEQHRASVLDKVQTPAYQPVPIAPLVPPVQVPVATAPTATLPPRTVTAPSALQRPAQRSIPKWKLLTAVAYVAMGAWFGGGVGATIGAIGGVMFVRWN